MMADRVSWKIRLAYALPAMSLAIIGIPIYVYLPKFYTDTVGIGIGTVGGLLMAVRVFDAVSDPVTGYFSDTLQTPWGRRRPWILLGVVGLALSLYFLFVPPDGAALFQVIRFGVLLFLVFFFWTIITVPYESLGPELTDDYHERTSLFGLRDGFLIIGTVLAAGSPAFASWINQSLFHVSGDRMTFLTLALMYGPFLIITGLICILWVKERAVVSSSDHDDFITGYRSVFQNRPFVILLTAYTISALGSNLPATLILYYVEYVLQYHNADIFLGLYFLVGIVFLPFWIAVSKKKGKKSAWMASMIINTGAFAWVFFLGPGDVRAYGVLVALSGVGFGAGLALPSSIQADVIDYDEWRTGKRREGRYIGLWSIAKKMAAALGVGIGLWALSRAGYRPNAVQPDEVVMLLRVLYALVPCLCNVMALGFISFYSIDEKRFEDIKTMISKRKHNVHNMVPETPEK